ncbi:MAG TPA: carboxypeptidase-like regulatory domain-containing protein [Candidatus Solibacter sp.]|nr:carboxypeptidase-like regulatory domain-containing protein [Candidatus Solibacter sp.]
MRLAPFLLTTALFAQQKEPERASIEGSVLNAATGEAVRKAQVTMHIVPPTLGAPVSFTTDANGKFSFTKLAPGNYVMMVRHSSFEMVKLGIRPDGNMGELIVLAPGESKTGFIVKMTPYGAIAGRVLDEDGDPVKGLRIDAMVWEYTARGRRLVEKRSAATDDQGDYRVYDVLPGKYVLRVRPPDVTNALSADETSFAPAFYPNGSDAQQASPVTLPAGQQLRGLNFTLRRARLAAVRGRVIAPEGATQLMVELGVRTDGLRTSHGIRDPQGKFELYGVPPGSFTLTGSYRSGTRRFVVQRPLEVGVQDINGLELRPIPPVNFVGQVSIEGESKTKLSDVKVTFDASGDNYVERRVDRDGIFTSSGLEPDVWEVDAHAPDLYMKSIRWGTQDITKDGLLDLTGGVPATTELEIVLGGDGGGVTGTVRNSKQEPAVGVVTLVPTNGSQWAHRYESTEQNGTFHLRGIPPGRYKLWAWDEVNRLAVMYDPDFLTPFQGDAIEIELRASEKKSQDLRLTVKK